VIVMRAHSCKPGLTLMAAVLLGASSIETHAQSVEDFYRGKSLKMTVAAAPGGGADLYARVVVRHLGRHIPGNPTFVVQHVPGAAGLPPIAGLGSGRWNRHRIAAAKQPARAAAGRTGCRL